MPPNSKTIYDEGAAIITHKLCDKGVFDEEGSSRFWLKSQPNIPVGQELEL